MAPAAAPLDELVSTILSQNTNDVNRDTGLREPARPLATWEAVRDADPQAVIEAIRPAAWATKGAPHPAGAARDHRRARPAQPGIPARPAGGRSPRLAAAFQRRGAQDGRHRVTVLPGHAGLPVDTHIYRVSGAWDCARPA